MKVWVAVRGVYADSRVVGVAASESEARDLVRAAYWDDYPSAPRDQDPMSDWTAGDVDGPFTLGQLKA